jgi:hypothetical protein
MSDVKAVRPIKQGTPIDLDRERHLLFDLNALAALEECYGDIDKALKELGKGSIKAIKAILWCGLLHEDPKLSQTEVGRLVTFDRVDYVLNKLDEAMKEAMPEDKVKVKAEGEIEENPQKPS